MRVCWTYSNKYNPPIPVIHLSIHTIDIKLVYPTIGTQEVIVDTGYDGYVLVPWNIYDMRLSLDLYQSPIAAIIESPLGGTYKLHIARVYIKIQEINATILTYVESYEESTEFFAGRSFINRLKMYLNGPNKELCLESINE